MKNSSIDAIIAEDILYMSAGLASDGCRPAGCDFACRVGFTEERFEGYLWEDGKTCYLSLVVSKQPGQGHFSELLTNLDRLGYLAKVPQPMRAMQAILTRKGFQPCPEDPTMWARS